MVNIETFIFKLLMWRILLIDKNIYTVKLQHHSEFTVFSLLYLAD